MKCGFEDVILALAGEMNSRQARYEINNDHVEGITIGGRADMDVFTSLVWDCRCRVMFRHRAIAFISGRRFQSVHLDKLMHVLLAVSSIIASLHCCNRW